MNWNEGAGSQNEIMLVGAICIDPDALADVLPYVRVDDFGNAVCKDAFESALELQDSSAEWNVMTIADRLCQHGYGEQSAADFLRECMTAAATSQNAVAYAKLVRDQAGRRALQKIADDISDGVFYHAASSEIITSALRAIEEIQTPEQSGVMDSTTAIQQWYAWADAAEQDPEFTLVRTGYAPLDRQLGGGLFKSGMYVIGARPGMGKTTVGINLADRIAARGKRVLFISLEMPAVQITAKRIAIRSGVPYNALMTGRLNSDDYRAVNTANNDLSAYAFLLADESRRTVTDIYALARKVRGLDVIFMDYLGLLSPAPEDVTKTRYEQSTNISAALKSMAKRLGIPIVVLCQLNRESTKTASKKPSLTDLRDSGAIEQDADGVILLHRDGYYAEEKPEIEDIKLIVAKNRHGATGEVTMTWKAASGAIYEQETRREYE